MPIAFDPEAIGQVYLSADADKKPRPHVRAKFITASQRGKIERAIDDIKEYLGTPDANDDGMRERLIEGLSIFAVGIANIPGVEWAGPQTLADCFTFDELTELLFVAAGQLRLQESERRGFTSPRQSATTESAKTAAAQSPVPSSKAESASS